MVTKVPRFSFQERQTEMADAGERDEEKLRSGEVSHADMALSNGGYMRGFRYKGPSGRIQALATMRSSKYKT